MMVSSYRFLKIRKNRNPGRNRTFFVYIVLRPFYLGSHWKVARFRAQSSVGVLTCDLSVCQLYRELYMKSRQNKFSKISPTNRNCDCEHSQAKPGVLRVRIIEYLYWFCNIWNDFASYKTHWECRIRKKLMKTNFRTLIKILDHRILRGLGVMNCILRERRRQTSTFDRKERGNTNKKVTKAKVNQM